MRFRAIVRGESLPVNIKFGEEADVRAVSRWRSPKSAPTELRDAIEFARLASKRWRFYRRSIRNISSLAEFRESAQPDRLEEQSMILIAKAEWFSESTPIGLALCRRTYCHNMTLEFLAVHPKAIRSPETLVRGIGSGLLYTVAALALDSKMPILWGEATSFSAPFYAKTFGIEKVNDLFVALRPQLKRCRNGFKKLGGELDHP